MNFPETPRERSAPRSRTILAVDDSWTNLSVLSRRLSHMGYAVSVSETGAGALELIAAHRYDLVILDMVMPGLSGIGVLNALRGSLETADLPVIMVTGRSDAKAAVAALAAGADDHIAKPFAFEELGARIDRVLQRAGRIAELQRANAMLDARGTAGTIELENARAELVDTRADRVRLVASIYSLHKEVERLSTEASDSA